MKNNHILSLLTFKTPLIFATVIAGTFLLSACGGSGNSSSSTPPTVVTPPADPVIPDPVDPSTETDSERAERYGLDPTKPPGGNFDLLDWYLNTPEVVQTDTDNDGNIVEIGIRIDEEDLDGDDGYTDSDYFYTADDGGMVFRVTNTGGRTSANTRYPRTELREMLRRGNDDISTRGINENNWVFSSVPESIQEDAATTDGTLRATLAVNKVTTTGEAFRVGRLIVGQIHGEDDEPIRLYYRKLPDNELGSIYAAHEIRGGEDFWHEIIGSRDDDASNPTDGIALDELWSYEIDVNGNSMDVTIFRGDLDDPDSETINIDMTNSGYDTTNDDGDYDWMYFKAGAYNQNNDQDEDNDGIEGEPLDDAIATFYVLENLHEGLD